MAKIPAILDVEGAEEAKAEGLAPVELYAGAFPWSKISGDPMDNSALAAILESFGVTPDGIKELVEAYFDELMTVSASAVKSLSKIEDMLGNLSTWDFFLFIQILDAKTEVVDFEAHAQDWEIHLTEDDREILASWWELLDSIRDFMNEINAEYRVLKKIVDTFQTSLIKNAQDLAEHIGRTDMHLKEGDYLEIIDHINDMGEYRHLNAEEYAKLFEGGFGNTVYDVNFPNYFLTRGEDPNRYIINTYMYVLFSGLYSMETIDVLHLNFEQMREYGALDVKNTAFIDIKVHMENTDPAVLVIDGEVYEIVKLSGGGLPDDLEPGDLKAGYFYRLSYDKDTSAMVLTAQSRIADSFEYDDDRTGMSVAQGNVLYKKFEPIEDRLAVLEKYISNPNIRDIYVQAVPPPATEVAEGSLWAW